jgi:hypothetical protein
MRFPLATLAAALVCVMLLAACGADPAVPLDRKATPALKLIGVVTPRFPGGPEVVLQPGIGRYNPYAYLIRSGIELSHDSQFTSLLQRQNFSVAAYFNQGLNKTLQGLGYSVRNIAVARSGSDFLETYPAVTPPVDAYLDLVIGSYGYLATGYTDASPYQPQFALRCRLVRARDSAVLMHNTLIYNASGSPDNVIALPPDSAYQFTDFQALMADPAKATDGLRVAIDQTLVTVASLLR